jgi:hypothetical protein
MLEDVGAASVKQLEISDQPDGFLHSVYHVENEEEVQLLMKQARSNGLSGFQVFDKIDIPETDPGWRETPIYPALLAKHREEVLRKP